MPEVVIEIETDEGKRPIIDLASVKTATNTFGKEDTVEEVIEAAKKVRDFIAKFTSKEE